MIDDWMCAKVCSVPTPVAGRGRVRGDVEFVVTGSAFSSRERKCCAVCSERVWRALVMTVVSILGSCSWPTSIVRLPTNADQDNFDRCLKASHSNLNRRNCRVITTLNLQQRHRQWRRKPPVLNKLLPNPKKATSLLLKTSTLLFSPKAQEQTKQPSANKNPHSSVSANSTAIKSPIPRFPDNLRDP
jgi:hypothetical protein